MFNTFASSKGAILQLQSYSDVQKYKLLGQQFSSTYGDKETHGTFESIPGMQCSSQALFE